MRVMPSLLPLCLLLLSPRATAGLADPPPDASRERLQALWADLASDDAAKAYRAHWALVAVPNQAVNLLKQHLKPAVLPEAARMTKLVADLDSGDFAVRDQATTELSKLGVLAEPALRQALKDGPPAEARRRIEQLLEKLQGPISDPERLRALRAVETLERIGTAEARSFLDALAKGAAEAELTREAKASLRRLTKSAPTQP